MAAKGLRLFWTDQLVGVITDAGWSDFPWASGELAVHEMPGELRSALEWATAQARSEGPLEDPPFPGALLENWWVEKPDGSKTEISATRGPGIRVHRVAGVGPRALSGGEANCPRYLDKGGMP
jgi:hypothetical protein